MRESLPGWNVPDIAGFDYVVNTYEAIMDDGEFSYDPNSNVAVATNHDWIRAHHIGLGYRGQPTSPLSTALQNVKRVALFYDRRGRDPSRIGNLRQLTMDFQMLQTIHLIGISGMNTLDLAATSAIDVLVRDTPDIVYIRIGPNMKFFTVDTCEFLEQVVAPMGYEGEVTVFECHRLDSIVGVAALIVANCEDLCDVPSLDVRRSTIGPGCDSLNFFWLEPTTHFPVVKSRMPLTEAQEALQQMTDVVVLTTTDPVEYEYLQQKMQHIFTVCEELIRNRTERTYLTRLSKTRNKALSVIVNGELSVFCSKEEWEKICTTQAGIEQRATELLAKTYTEPLVNPEARFDLYVHDTEVNEAWPEDVDKNIIIVPAGSTLHTRRTAHSFVDEPQTVLAAGGISGRELVELLCEPMIRGNLLYSVRRRSCNIVLIGDIPWTRELQYGLGFFEANNTHLFIECNALVTALSFDYELFEYIEIRECPSLRSIRLGLFNHHVKVARCDSLAVIYSPLHSHLKGSIRVNNCSSLTGIFVQCERTFASNCPKLQFLPCEMVPGSGVSLGPGCPLIPFPHKVVRDQRYSVELVPLLADAELSAAYMQNKELFRQQALAGDAVKAEFVRQVALFERSRNREYHSETTDAIYGFPHRVVYPQPTGAFTWLATIDIGSGPNGQHVNTFNPVCFVGNEKELTKALTVHVHSMLFASMVSARKKMRRPRLPREMWEAIADFLIPNVKK